MTIEYLRQFHIFNYAIFDLVLSYVGVYLLAPLLSKLFRKLRIDISRKGWMYLTLPIGILSHLAVGNITPMTEEFFNPQGHYILKIIIVLMAVLGFKEIKILPKKSE